MIKTFKWEKWPALLSAFFVVLFLILGFWQLHRYHYKKIELARYEKMVHASPVMWRASFLNAETEWKKWRFQHVEVSGYFLNRSTLLLANRFHQGVPGYDVITPFQILGANRLLLVNRGFIPARPAFKTLPMVPEVAGYLTLRGHVKLFNPVVFTLGSHRLSAPGEMLVVQKVAISELERWTQLHFYPFFLQLDAQEIDKLTADETLFSVSPFRHLGYAIQWFMMALVLCIAYWSYSHRG